METIPLAPTRRQSKFSCCPAQQNDGLRVIVFCFGVLCVCVTIALVISIYLGEPEVLPSGAVATDSLQCSQVGVDVLKRGGNAVDAAIASSLCMCVVNPHITSVGGGGAMIVLNHRTSRSPTVINFQDAAPASFADASADDSRTVGVPGLLSGLWESHRLFGKYDWADLVQPAIDLSVGGINVSSALAAAAQNLPDSSPIRRSQLFFPNGIPLAEGQVIRQPALAKLLTALAINGSQAFYNGPFGDSLANFMNKRGAGWTKEDLQGYRAKSEQAISGTFGRTTVYTSSAPTGGPQLIALLNILAGFNSKPKDHFRLPYNNQLIEAMRIVQDDVKRLGDPLVNDEVRQAVDMLTNTTYADEMRKLILPNTILNHADALPVPRATASIVSVMDNEDGYAVIVSGLNSMFGSGLEAPDGYLLNNALANFYPNSTLPNGNGKPGQRPLQGILPVVATETNGRCGLRFVAGSSEATLLGQVVMNLLQFNQTAIDAIRTARIQTQAMDRTLDLENTPQFKLPDSLVKALENMNYQILGRHPPYSSINIVLRNGDSLVSESDGRGGGHSVKYGP